MITMKCALELQATATKRAEEIRQNEMEKARQKEAEIKKNTIQFCEKLGEQLEREANAGKVPEVDFYMEFHWYSGDFRGRQMFPTRKDYADKRVSFNPTGEELDLKIMADWFKPYCFTVNYKKESVWEYGWGCHKAYHVYIKPAPECLN